MGEDANNSADKDWLDEPGLTLAQEDAIDALTCGVVQYVLCSPLLDKLPNENEEVGRAVMRAALRVTRVLRGWSASNPVVPEDAPSEAPPRLYTSQSEAIWHVLSPAGLGHQPHGPEMTSRRVWSAVHELPGCINVTYAGVRGNLSRMRKIGVLQYGGMKSVLEYRPTRGTWQVRKC